MDKRRLEDIYRNVYILGKKYHNDISYNKYNYCDLYKVFNWILEEFKYYIFIYPVFNSENILFYQYELVDLKTQQFPISHKEWDIQEYKDILCLSIDETLNYIRNK